MDLGNGFARHARLQKAADAAALAGAATFAMNQETVDSHPKADAQAEIYAKVNWGEWESIISKAAPGEDGGWCIVLSRSSSGVDTYDIYQICGY